MSKQESSRLFSEKPKVLKPFQIRTHHLFDWGYGFLKTHTPEEFADKLLNEMNRMRSDGTKRERKYAFDLGGDNFEEYSEARKRVLNRFVDLPDDYPVELTVEQEDEICRTCPIGKHCTLTRHTEYTGTNIGVVQGEEYCLDIFLDKADELNIDKSKILLHLLILESRKK